MSISPDLKNVIWHVTNKCNLSCGYCSTNSTPEAEFGPDREQWEHVVDLIADVDPVRIGVTGGEALVRDDLPEIISRLPEAPMLSIDTNGLLLEEKWCEEFERVNHISISVDGPKLVHNSQRGAYDAVMKNIEWALDKDIEVRSTVTLTENNIDVVKDTVRYLDELGVTGVGFNRIRAVGRNADNNYDLDAEKYTKQVAEAEALARDRGMAVSSSGWYGSYFEHADTEGLPSCFCGVYRATIRYDGSVLPCQMLSYDNYYEKVTDIYDVPNVYEYESLDEVLETPLFEDFQDATTQTLPNGCDGCEHTEYCDHGCRAEAWFRGYGLNGTNELCSIARNQSDEVIVRGDSD